MLIERLLLHLLRADIVNEGKETPERIGGQTLPAGYLHQFRGYVNRRIGTVAVADDEGRGIGGVEVAACIGGGGAECEHLVRLPFQRYSPPREPFPDSCNLSVVLFGVPHNYVHLLRTEPRLFNNIYNIVYTVQEYDALLGIHPFPVDIYGRVVAFPVMPHYFQCRTDGILRTFGTP